MRLSTFFTGATGTQAEVLYDYLTFHTYFVVSAFNQKSYSE